MTVEYKDRTAVIFANRNFDGVIWYQPRLFLESFSDTVIISDALIKDIQLTRVDGVNFSDSIVKDVDVNLSDEMIVSDSLVKDMTKVIQDTALLSDAIAMSFGMILQDIVALSDALSKSLGKDIQDAIGITDEILFKDIGKPLSDSVYISDDIVKDLERTLSDIAYLSDDIVKQLDKSLTDNVLVSDEYTRQLGLAFSDSVFVSDALFKNVNRILSDRVLISEQLSKEVSKIFQSIVTFFDDIEITKKSTIPIIFRDMVIAQRIRQVLAVIKDVQVLATRTKEATSLKKINSVTCDVRIREVTCIPIHLHGGGHMGCPIEGGEMDLLEFSPKQNWEEYYNVFNFARVITPETTIASAVIIVTDAEGVDVTDDITDDTQTQIVGSKVYVWVRRGTEQVYKITCRITMDNGEKFEQDASMEVIEV